MAPIIDDFDPLASSSRPDKEDILSDKFAVLFNPSTPRASPTFPEEASVQAQPSTSKSKFPTSNESGTFVEVLRQDDPLGSPGFGSFQSAEQSTRSLDLSFFDAFTSEAERRSDIRKEQLFDPHPPSGQASAEWDLDYFNSLSAQQPQESIPQTQPDSQTLLLEINTIPSSPPTSPPRSPALTRPKLTRTPTAPSIAHPSISPDPSPSTELRGDPMSHSWHAAESIPISSSYQTLSNISRKIGHPSSSSSSIASDRSRYPDHKRGTLDSIWDGIGSGIFGHSRSFTESSSASAGSSTLDIPSQQQHTSSLPHKSTSSPSPFGSTFGSHKYVPPSGAPGYKGESGYDWDKGFSHELEEELSRPPTPKSKSGVGTPIESVGELIAKKGGSIKLVGRKQSTAGVLDEKLGDEIRPSLPAIPRLSKTWTLLYSMDQDGISLRTLYEKSDLTKKTPSPKKPSSILMVVQDSYDALFGVYLSDSRGIKLPDDTRERRYYGSGESFLFSKQSSKSRLKIFKWTTKNDYIALCENESLSFGGGNTTFGLYIASNLLDGSSGVSETFENDVLCHESNDTSTSSSLMIGGGSGDETKRVRARRKGVDFEIVGLEVWGIGG